MSEKTMIVDGVSSGYVVSKLNHAIYVDNVNNISFSMHENRVWGAEGYVLYKGKNICKLFGIDERKFTVRGCKSASKYPYTMDECHSKPSPDIDAHGIIVKCWLYYKV